MLLSLAAASVIGFVWATPAVASPGESSTDSSASGENSTSVLPVVGVMEGMWGKYVVPNAPAAPPNLDVGQFIPTTTQVSDFFAFIQQFRGPVSIQLPRG